MITNFALSLSLDGIELLHRVPRGWRLIGRVDVASETLNDDLKALREKAELIEPDGLRTKVVIPLDQIKYTTIDGTRTTDDDIHDVLDGATPYALDELVIDNEKSGGRTHIAAVARETLQEAETFAEAHGFEPVAFVAVPAPFTFPKEIFFGPTSVARRIVGPDAIIAREDLPVMKVGTRVKSRLLIFDAPHMAEETTYKDDLAALLATDAPVAQPQETPEPEMTPEVIDPEPTPVAQAIWVDKIPDEYHRPAPAPTPAPAPEVVRPPLIPAHPELAQPAILDRVIAEYHRKTQKATKAPLVAKGARAKPLPATLAAPLRSAPPRPAQSTAKNRRPALIAAGIAAAAVMTGGLIWSQQSTQDTVSASTAEPVEAQVATMPEPATPTAPIVELNPQTAEIVVQAMTGPEPTDNTVAVAGIDAAPEFAQVPEAITFAEADNPLAPVQAPPAPPIAPTAETAQAEVGAPVLRGQVLSPDEAERIYAATGVYQRAPRFLDEPTGVIPLNFDRPAAPAAPVRIQQPQMAALDEFETDLSFLAPANPPAPEVVFPRDEDGFILATPEGAITPEGALVFAGLPDLTITPRPQLSQSDLDRMALLTPAPDGVVIIAGAPAVTPPLRPSDAALPETDPDLGETAALAAVPSRGGVGLEGLQVQNSGAIALDPEVVEERALLDLRPRLRPQGLVSAEEPGTPDITDILAGIETDDATLRFDNSTALAVVLSLRPDARPANFSRVVAAASARRQAPQAAPSSTAPASAAPVVAAAPVAPRNLAPVPGGVARAATQEDAIRLRQINLIGVYGRPSARRALVRLSNGRYVRVEIGSSLDGGEVTAIGDDALNYVKRGRTYAIELP